MLWVFIVTMAVLLLAILVVFDFHKTRLNEQADRRLRMLTKLSMSKARVKDAIEGHLVHWPNAKMIRSFLRELSKYTKLAGVQHDRTIAQYLQQMWKKHGLNDTRLESYSVLLSLPDKLRPNRVAVLSVPSQHRWTPLASHEKEIPGVATTFTPPFNAYSPSGNATGAVIYCNRCLPQDFQKLASMKLDTRRKVCLCRYSVHVSPGTAMMHADNNHVAGVLFFLDPVDVAPHTGMPVFPNSWWMPSSAIRRSSLRSDGDIGDPTTRGYSSRGYVKNLYRCPTSELRLPGVLSHPISSTSAQTIFKHMQGEPCPDGWMPQLAVRCNLGDKSDTQVRMHIYNKLQRAHIENVMSHIQGSVEPDRYVVLGVPIDAWSTGAVAPGTAIAQILELSRVFGHLVTHKDWKPRRTIVFAGWDGRQFGHLGSTEYIEGKRRLLMSRAAIYVNTDMCASGGEFKVSASPSVMDSFESAAQVVPYFQNVKEAYYSAWRSDAKTRKTAKGVPELPTLRSQGSHLPVVQYTGVPSLDVSFGNNHSGGLYYPAMGTGYDTFEIVDKFIDPGFKVQKMCAQLIGVVLRRWADAAVLPYNLERLRRSIKSGFAELERKHAGTIRKHNVNIGAMRSAVGRLAGNLGALANYVGKFQLTNPIETRQLNDRIMHMERIFVQDVAGHTGIVRNTLFGWSTTNKGRMVFFPMLDEMLTKQGHVTAAQPEPILLHVSRVASALHQAADFVDLDHIV